MTPMWRFLLLDELAPSKYTEYEALFFAGPVLHYSFKRIKEISMVYLALGQLKGISAY